MAMIPGTGLAQSVAIDQFPGGYPALGIDDITLEQREHDIAATDRNCAHPCKGEKLR
jgi:hypothetical protein